MIAPETKNKSSYTSEVKEQHLRYWKQQLAGATGRVDLPLDYSRPAAGMNNFASFQFTIPGSSRDILNLINHQYRTSLFVMLLSAFNTLLYRYTKQTDIVVGYSGIDNKTSDNYRLRENIGRITPLRIDLSGNPAFPNLLQHVHKIVADANEHKDFPVEILEDASLSNEGSKPVDFYQVIFSFQDIIAGEDNEFALPLDCRRKDNYVANVDLLLFLQNTAAGVNGVLEYSSELFEADTISQMAEHLQVLLDNIIANPEQRIDSIPILSESERYKLVVEWNNTHTDYPHDKCIHELFEEQVQRTPDAIAAVLHDGVRTSSSKAKRQLTYFELNQQANQLANYLQRVGVGPEVVVGVFMKRSLEMVVAVLGVLKAGAAYLPLDPGHPKSRLDFILKDSGISIILSQYQLMRKLPPHETLVICLDTEWNKIAVFNDKNPGARANPENLAYIIYTSGSTGVPKGTLIIHRGVVNYLSWCIKAYDVGCGNGCPVNSSLGFDATVTSFLSPLLVGKQVLLLPEEGEIEALSEVLCSNRKFSLVKITPAHMEILGNLIKLDELGQQANAFIIGGEALKGTSLDLWRRHAPSTRLINEYGPTETVVGCCVYEVPEHLQLSGDVPIGRPIANTQVYILDSNLQPLPIGVVGEIYIGGAGLARGYLNRPDLTTERFIPNPFSGDPNARLYKTGDLARFLKDGNIVFVGRSDHQVKIRGYRIELGEIESALGQFPGVQQCVVTGREDSPGDKRLVAYLVFPAGDTVAIKDLKLFLGEKLPEYMIPAVFMMLKTLPLTTNGKIDRAALPIPDQERPELEKEFVEAHTHLEIELTTFFEQALRMNHISIADNLFELGINSMQAYWVFAQIKKGVGIQLPLSILFQAPTIRQLAAYLDGKQAHAAWSSLVAIQPNGSKSPLFCIHAGGGTVLFYRDLSRNLGPDQPVYGLQPQGLDGKSKFHNSIEEMASHYIKEIRTIKPGGPYLLGGYCFGGVIAFEMAQQLTAQGYKVALLATFNAVSPTYVATPHNNTTNSEEKLQPGTSVTILSRFRWQCLAKLNNKEKVLYFARKIKNKLSGILKYKILDGYVMFVYMCCMKLRLQCPESMRKYYFLATNSGMVKSYKPKPYPGQMTIFRSPGIYRDPHIGWSNFVVGGIKTFDVPGIHKDRRQIMNEPFVQLTAEELKIQIDKCTMQEF